MLTTAVAVLVLGGMQVASFLLWMLLFRLSLKWLKATDPSWWRIFKMALVIEAVGLSFTINCLFLESTLSNGTVVLSLTLAALIAVVIIQCAATIWMFKTSIVGSLIAFLFTSLGRLTIYVLVLMVITPFVVQSFKTNANSMAPTLLGVHLHAICPECGSSAYGSAASNGFENPLMICEKNFHIIEVVDADKQQLSADHFLVAKYLKAQRWDIVVFEFPEDPNKTYVKRLIGLPGEEITIRDGDVWADGKRIERPKSLAGIRYIFEESPRQELWGIPDNPAKLASDEYFVLGDFSMRSADSRYWQHGAEGHNPFAVPASHLQGVVTHIYWPTSRMRILR